MNILDIINEYKDKFYYLPSTQKKCGRLFIDYEQSKKLYNIVATKYNNVDDINNINIAITKIFILISIEKKMKSGDLIIAIQNTGYEKTLFMYIVEDTRSIIIDPDYDLNPDIAIFNNKFLYNKQFPIEYWE
tara:strand:+ start:3216 stop:3611 length:396 start_codon:yes stop_codon:yes gene_type:complete